MAQPQPQRESDTVVVPGVVGKLVAQAESTLENDQLEYTTSGTGPTVIAQDPKAGTVVNVGSTVALTLGSSW